MATKNEKTPLFRQASLWMVFKEWVGMCYMFQSCIIQQKAKGALCIMENYKEQIIELLNCVEDKELLDLICLLLKKHLSQT